MERGVPIRSVSRAIAILQAINQKGALSMMQISRMGDVPYPTACRIIQTLMHEGLVEQEPSRKYYRPTVMVQSLSHGFQTDSLLVETGREHIRELTRRVGWPVSLTVRVGTNMVVRDSTHGETSLTFERYYPGYRLPLLDCASGRVCLAHMRAEELDNVMRWVSLSGVEEESSVLVHLPVNTLQKIRDAGYCAIGWGQHNLTPGKTSSIAVPVFRGGNFEASLTLIYFSAAMKQDEAIKRYVDDLKQTAIEISSALTSEVIDFGERKRAH